MSGSSTLSQSPLPSTKAVQTTGVNSLTSLGNAINSTLASAVGSIPSVPQYFFTVPFPNNQTVLYRLRIYNNPNDLTPIEEFIFPLTPMSISKQSTTYTSYYDVRGGPTNPAGRANAESTGVNRIIDQYGQTPPTITIAGTTGFQFHSLDGYQWSGRSSFAKLVNFISAYSTKVMLAINSSQNVPLPIMEFTDGFTGEVFLVAPLTQVYAQDSARPIIQTYNITLLCQQVETNPQSLSLSQQDPVLQFFINTKALLTAGLLSWWNALLNNIPGSGVIA